MASLIAHAAALGGTNLCIDGHAWESDGGRGCPFREEDEKDCGGSQPVFVCSRCGVFDYGEKGGPGAEACEKGDCFKPLWSEL